MIGSLFSGIGGIELGLESCGLGPVMWQCDNDPHARAVLATHWPSVFRYSDVREIDETAKHPDIICGGFPCQDISLAGKGAGIDGARSGLWSEYARIVRALRPAVVFVENVAALVNRGLDRVLGDLAALGFDAEWDVFRASDLGAPHRRERLFLLAYADRERVRQLAERGPRRGQGERTAVREHAEPVYDRAALADADGQTRRQEARLPVGIDGAGAARFRTSESGRFDSGVLADAASARCYDAQDAGADSGDEDACAETQGRWTPGGEQSQRDGGGALAHADSNGCESIGRSGLFDGERTASGYDPDRRDRAHRFPPGPAAIAGWDGPQPAIRRGDDGVPGRSHRLRLLGNSVVPQQAALAWRTLIARTAQSRAA